MSETDLISGFPGEFTRNTLFILCYVSIDAIIALRQSVKVDVK